MYAVKEMSNKTKLMSMGNNAFLLEAACLPLPNTFFAI
jgi:hypothetical protein